MTLRLDDKKAIVAEVADVANTALSAAAADYRGLTVGEMNQLRTTAREKDLYLKVVRNTLVKRAVAGTSFECMQEHLLGPLLYAFSSEEPGAPAKLFNDFVKDHKKLEVKMLVVNGKFYGGEHLGAIAKLPSRDEALATLLMVMKAPVTKFVRTLAEPHAKLVRTVAAIRDSKK